MRLPSMPLIMIVATCGGLLAKSGQAQCYTNAEVIISGTSSTISDSLAVRFTNNSLEPERLFLRTGFDVSSWTWVEYQASTRRMLPFSTEPSLIAMDFDGSGPEGTRLVRMAGPVNTTFRFVETFNGTSWTPLPTPGGSLPVPVVPGDLSRLPLLVAWDHDSNAATPTRLMAIVNDQMNTMGLFQYQTGANPGWTRVLNLGQANLTGFGARVSITAADIDGAGSTPRQLFISRNGSIQDVIAINPNYTTVSYPFPFQGFPVAPSQLMAFDPDGAGPQPDTLYAQAEGTRLFRFDPVGFDGLFWIDMGQVSGTISSVWDLTYQWGDPDGTGPLAPTVLASSPWNALRNQSWRHDTATNTWQSLTGPSKPPGLIRPWDRDPASSPPIEIAGDFAGLYRRTGSTWTEIEAWPSTNVLNQTYGFADFDGAGPNPATLYVVGTMSAYGLQDFNVATTINRIVRVNADGSRTLVGSPYQGSTGQIVVAGGLMYITSFGTPGNNPPTYAFNPVTNGVLEGTSTLRTGIAWDADGPGPLPERFTTVSGRNVVQWNVSTNSMVTITSVPNFATTTGFDLRSIALWDADGSGPNPPRIVVAGQRQRPGGNVGYIGIFDGTSWQTVGDLGTGVSVTCTDPLKLVVNSWDQDGPGPLTPRLIVSPITAGASGASSIPVAGVGAWTGSTWINLAMPSATEPFALLSWDPDGNGPLNPLVVASQVYNQLLTTWSNGVTTNWGGQDPQFVHSTVPVDSSGRQGLLVSYRNERLLRLVCPAAVPCLADVAGANQSVGADGSLTADDIIVFLGWFFASDTRADVAGANQSPGPDTQFTADDIIVFLGAYFAGCP